MKARTIGDVHLGKEFKQGVPLHRRGEREAMQLAQFRQELDAECDLSVQMGDLFDKMVVPYTVIYQAYLAYRDAIARNPGRVYAVLKGNHDESRDADKVSAFRVFTQMVRPLGVIVVDEHPVRMFEHVFIPWHPFKSAVEMLDEDTLRGAKFAYGHWDVVMGQENQLPAAQLKALGIERAFTGHDHNAREITLDGLDVTVTGSMQPYSHAEDEAGVLYVTVSLAEAAAGQFADKCVRVLLEPGEVLDFPVECLQLTTKRVGVEDAVDVGEVEFEEFDFLKLFGEAAEQVGLSEAMRSTALGKLEEARARAG